jgi:hypothetical protein
VRWALDLPGISEKFFKIFSVKFFAGKFRSGKIFWKSFPVAKGKYFLKSAGKIFKIKMIAFEERMFFSSSGSKRPIAREKF